MADFEGIIKTYQTGENGTIPESAIKALATAIKTAVGNEYVDKERYKAKLAEIDKLNNSLTEQKQTAEDSATTAGNWKEKYDAEHKAFEQFKADAEAEKAMAEKKAAYEEVCKDAGLNETGIRRALKYCDWAAVELDEKGKIKDAKAHIKSLHEEWPDHVMSATTTGAATPNPPANTGGKAITAEEIMKISDTVERQKAIAENHELFGF